MTITSEPVNMKTVGWAGNVSLQAVERSDPPFLEILTDEMSVAYALATQLEAVQTLDAATATAGGVLGPTVADVVGQLAGAVGQAYTATLRRVWADTVWANLAGWTFLAGLTDLSGNYCSSTPDSRDRYRLPIRAALFSGSGSSSCQISPRPRKWWSDPRKGSCIWRTDHDSSVCRSRACSEWR